MKTFTMTLVLISSIPALAESVYTPSVGKTEGGIDLTAMSDTYADRINTPSSGTAEVWGGLTISPASNPFTIFGCGGHIKFGDSSRLEQYLVKLQASDSAAAVSEISFDGAKEFRKGIHVGAGTKLVVNSNEPIVVVGTGSDPAVLTVDGAVKANSAITAGNTNGTANVCVTGSLDMDGCDLILAVQKAPLASDFTPKAVLDVSGSLICRHLDCGSGLLKTFEKVDVCFVTNRGLITVERVCATGAGWHHVVFAGGQLTAVSSSAQIFHATGIPYVGYVGGYTHPGIFVEGLDDNPVDISIVTDRNLCGGDNYRPIKFTGNAGFVKRGAGLLTFTHNNSYYWDSVSTRFDIKGPTTIKGGGIKLKTAWFTPGRGMLKLEGEGTTYDINGVKQRDAFTGATGVGSIINTADAAATIPFGYSNASAELNVVIGPRVNLEKRGTGTLTICERAGDFAGDLVVSNGTVKLATDMTSLATVTIAKGATLDVRGYAFAFLKLVNDGSLLTDADSSVTFCATNSQTFNMPDALTAFSKTGDGTLTVDVPSAVSEGVTVAGGTLIVRQSSNFSGKYLRYSMIDNTRYPKCDQVRLNELTLVDACGNRIAITNCLWNPIDGSGKIYGGYDGINDASTLQECEAQLWGKGNDWYQSIPKGQGPEKLFDNDASTCHSWQYYWRTHPPTVVVRLPNDAPSVVGYKMMRGSTGVEAPITWKFEGSLDGKSWTTLDQTTWDVTDSNQLEAAIAAVPAKEGLYYNNDIPYPLASFTNTAERLPFGTLTPVKIAAGAMYAAADQATKLDAIEVDLAEAGRGTVSNFTVVANGVLSLRNYANAYEEAEIPMDFLSMADMANFSTWRVKVDGEYTLHRIRVRDGKLIVRIIGMMLICR